MEIVFDFKPDKKDISFLEQQLFSYNCSKVEIYSYENFIIKAIREDASMIGGIHAQIGGGWLYIASLWVDENDRGKGVGKTLLRLAEKTAFEKNCHGAYLYTYTFQCPPFYEKCGYRIMGTLDNFCGNHKKHFMKKNLS